MRIISNFHDYYDSCKKFDLENFPIYKRKTEEEIFKNSFINNNNNHYLFKFTMDSFKINKFYFLNFLILFCGKLYKGFRVCDEQTKFFYNIDDIENFILNNIKDKKIIDNFYRSYFLTSTYKKLKNYLSDQGKDFDLNIFQKHNSPIIAFENRDYTNNYYQIINPNLKYFEFFKIHDVYSTYQQINMFVSGVLTNTEKEIPKISDELKLQSKGFDKWSFRKKGKK
jgi:hypothetical protein